MNLQEIDLRIGLDRDLPLKTLRRECLVPEITVRPVFDRTTLTGRIFDRITGIEDPGTPKLLDPVRLPEAANRTLQEDPPLGWFTSQINHVRRNFLSGQKGGRLLSAGMRTQQ